MSAFNKKVIVGSCGLALGLISTSVLAAPVSLPQNIITALGTEWDVENNTSPSGTAFGGSCSSSGMHINDAESTTGDSDLYDDAFGIWINDTAFIAPDPVDLTGNTITAGPVAMSGLNVTMVYDFSDTIEAVRSTVTLQNPTGSAIVVTLDIANNFGSDSNTTIVATSSGDLVFTTADSWVVTWDNSSEINTTAITTPGNGLTPDSVTDTVFSCAGTQGFGARYTANVPAGSSTDLRFGGAIAEIDGAGDSDPSRAVAQVSSVFSFAGISAVSSSVGATPIPALPLWGLLSLIGITGLLGLFQRGRQV